jgi:hypothetical protein
MPLPKLLKPNLAQTLSSLKTDSVKSAPETSLASFFQKQPATTTIANASADAVGENTLATTSTTLKTMDVGIVAITRGTVSATALAQSTGSTPYASAATQATMPPGDLLIQRNTNVNGAGQDSAGAWSYASSTTSFLSIDLQGIDLKPRIVENVTETTITTRPASVSGNLATFNVDASARGADTLTETQVSAITVENLYSSATTTTTVSTQTDSLFEFFHSLF